MTLKDKIAHIVASATIAACSFALLALVGAPHVPAIVGAALVAAAAGFTKEVADAMHGYAIDPLDLAADAIGLAIGLTPALFC